jgi:hypothetical protein
MLFGQAHIERYVATGGAEGLDWQGTQTEADREISVVADREIPVVLVTRA